MLKFFGSVGTNTLSFKKNNLDYPAATEALGLENTNYYSNLTYKMVLKNNWKFYVGSSLSYNADINTIRVDDTDVKGILFEGRQQNVSSLFQLRTVLTANVFTRSKLHWGTEYQRTQERQTDTTVNGYTDNYGALFTEMDTYFSDNVSARIGVRSEYSSVLQKINIAPRVSVGYTFENNSLLSASYGKFYQKPERNYLYNTRTWDFTEANHYIFSFQQVDSYQTIRAEVFYKKYDNLVTISPTLANNGSGYAQGIELFWRDKKNLKGFDYWVSYSLLDTKRKHLSFPNEVQPSFAATHTFSVVLKKYFEKISTNISTSYSYASGRPYYNPNRPDSEFMTDRTNDYHNLSLSVAYLPKIKNMFSVLVLTFSNVLGNNQTFGYTYSNTDFARREAIGPVVNPFVFLGYFINFGVDRRDDIINSRIQ
jgi:vitamin B12 transporter